LQTGPAYDFNTVTPEVIKAELVDGTHRDLMSNLEQQTVKMLAFMELVEQELTNRAIQMRADPNEREAADILVQKVLGPIRDGMKNTLRPRKAIFDNHQLSSSRR
jgi:hypothetical protein